MLLVRIIGKENHASNMAEPFIDTNILIRFLTKDDPDKRARATAFFERVEKGELKVIVPVVVIAEAVYVLSSPRLYNLSRPEVFGMLDRLIRIPNFKVRNRRMVMRALDLYLTTNLDFEDAFIVVSMLQVKTKTLYSFDEGFDRVQAIKRLEP
jgi:predicted nucleic acid-binding protein